MSDPSIVRAAIFDFDGTLFDSSPAWEEVLVGYLDNFGVPAPEGCIMDEVKALGLHGGAKKYIESYRIPRTPEQVVTSWREAMGKRYREDIPLHAHAYAYLEKLKAQDVYLALATAMERDFVESALERTGANVLFDLAVTTGDLGVDKNSPRIFEHCIEAGASTNETSVVFEDSPTAARVCQAAGIPVIGVFDGMSEQDFMRIQPYCVKTIRSYSELL